MQGLNPASRQSIYFGISYTVTAQWSSEAVKRLDFQRVLAEGQLDFSQTKFSEAGFSLVRLEPSALVVNIASLGPGVSNISISSNQPCGGLEIFCREAEAVCRGYREVWLEQQSRILKCKATVHHLYSCGGHAFKYLWEERLGQKPEDFKYLGSRPVLGGGVRFVMPPLKGDEEPLQIEMKAESYFRELDKMFIETIFIWPKPRLLGTEEDFDPRLRLLGVEEYAATKVCDFISRQEEIG